MNNRIYHLILFLMASFIVMLLYIFFQFTPNIIFLLLSFIFFIALLIYILSMRDNICKNGSTDNHNKYLPIILQKSKILRVVFASLAVSVIITSFLFVVFNFIFGIDALILYVESYFMFHIIGLGVMVSPFVWKFLKD